MHKSKLPGDTSVCTTEKTPNTSTFSVGGEADTPSDNGDACSHSTTTCEKASASSTLTVTSTIGVSSTLAMGVGVGVEGLMDTSVAAASASASASAADKLKQSLTIFKYIEDKDFFLKVYSKHFARRLIYTQCASFENEEFMIHSLKVLSYSIHLLHFTASAWIEISKIFCINDESEIIEDEAIFFII